MIEGIKLFLKGDDSPKKSTIINLAKEFNVSPINRETIQEAVGAQQPGPPEVGLSGAQFIEQRLRLLQIERIEAFGEPALDRSEKLASLFPLALIAPEPRHAHRGAEF
jgi:hypothetical protein